MTVLSTTQVRSYAAAFMHPKPQHQGFTLRISAALLLLVALSANAGPIEESPYNKGVAAWRAKDFAEARKQWAQSLAMGGPARALNNLAFLLYNGLGGEPNPAKAVELWSKGAALAVSEAQLHLGEAYEAGKGIDRDSTAAYAWYRCAIATAGRLSGHDKTEAEIEKMAAAQLDQLRPELSAAEVAEGEKLAALLIAKYSDVKPPQIASPK
nr:hypothetical protein [uncultured Roseateles sp.]